MDMEALKQKILQDLKETKSRLEEREAYQQLKERWDNLAPHQRKVVLILAPILALSLILMPAFTRWADSSDYITEFEDKKELIRALMLAQKDLSDTPGIGNSLSSEQIKSRIEGEIFQDGLLPDQVSPVTAITEAIASSPNYPSKIVEGVYEASLKQVTIRQLMQIGTRIENIGPQVKLKDLIVKADTQAEGYLNATLRFVVFTLTDPADITPEPPQNPRGRR